MDGMWDHYGVVSLSQTLLLNRQLEELIHLRRIMLEDADPSEYDESSLFSY